MILKTEGAEKQIMPHYLWTLIVQGGGDKLSLIFHLIIAENWCVDIILFLEKKSLKVMQLTFNCYNHGLRDITLKQSGYEIVQFLFFYYLQCPLDGGVYQYNCLVKSQKKDAAPPQSRRLEDSIGDA